VAEADIRMTSDEGLPSIIGLVQTMEERYAVSALEPHLEACRSLLQEKELIDVGIFGRFKAGKSSLLNLLAGRSVLPVGVTPVTTVITRLRYGAHEQGTVHFRDGRTKRVLVDAVRSYVSEADNPRNSRKVAAVTVELPSLKPYQGLQFVDTPGLDSVFQHNTEAALDWLPKVGLALVSVSADQPLSKYDVTLIRTLRSYTPKIVVLVTKIDLLSASETEEVMAFVRDELRQEFGKEFRIFTFSVRPTFGDLKASFDKDLLHPLLENRKSARTDIVRFKFAALLNQTKEYLSVALAAAERIDADRSRLREQILNERTSSESIRTELQALAEEWASQTRPWIVKRMEELGPALGDRLKRELATELPKWKGNLWKFSRAYERWLRESITRAAREISQQEGSLFCVPLQKAQATLSRAARGFRDRLAGNISDALNIRFTVEPFDIEAKRPAAPQIGISNLFMFNLDLFWFVIPMSLFRPLVERHFFGRIAWEVEKNLSRLASQWTAGINSAILQMQREAERSVRDQISTVESLLSRTQSEAEGIKASLSEIESYGSAVLAR
jgi:small GTP-binding protein